MIPSIAGSQLELDGLARAALMYQPSLDYGAKVHFKAVVLHVSCDASSRLKFKEFARVDRPDDRAVDNQMGNMDFPFDAGMFAENQCPSAIAS
jgi:hypothetical protein